ncbi:MAG: hypothetical protein ACYSUT_08815 [Planctomycetota bacterium]|jgi:hypothetical protein
MARTIFFITLLCFIASCSSKPALEVSNAQANIEGSSHEERILKAGRALLEDIRAKHSEGQVFFDMISGENQLERISTHNKAILRGYNESINLPEVIGNLNPKYICITQNSVRVEFVGGFDNPDVYGYFIYAEGSGPPSGSTFTEIIPGLWSYGIERRAQKIARKVVIANFIFISFLRPMY